MGDDSGVLYLATSPVPAVRAAMIDGALGLMNTPANGYDLAALPGVTWAADNGCFSASWNPYRWLTWLQSCLPYRGTCLFAAVPDVVGDHAATLARWHEWSPVVRELGYPLAFVLQDGVTSDEVPWDEFEWLFIGGTTGFKLSAPVRDLALEGRRHGKSVHMGRVNSKERAIYAAMFCDTADGTFLAFGPDVNLPRLLRYMRTANNMRDHGTLFDG